MIKIIVSTVLITLGVLFSLAILRAKLAFEEKVLYFWGLIFGVFIGYSAFTLLHI